MPDTSKSLLHNVTRIAPSDTFGAPKTTYLFLRKKKMYSETFQISDPLLITHLPKSLACPIVSSRNTFTENIAYTYIYIRSAENAALESTISLFQNFSPVVEKISTMVQKISTVVQKISTVVQKISTVVQKSDKMKLYLIN